MTVESKPPSLAEPQSIPDQSRDETTRTETQTPTEAPALNMWSLVAVFIGLCFAVLCTSLDRAIIGTAIPRITSEFHSLEDVGWYGSAFLMTMCAFQLLCGKLYVHLDIKWVFLSSVFVFEVGSVICAAAPSSVALIVGRAVAGIGASGIISGAMIIIAKTVPLHQRPMFTGSFGGVVGIAQVVAPTLGGVFTDKLTWRWCFWINLPFGAVTFLTVIFLLRLPPSPQQQPRSLKALLISFDLVGTALLIPWVICLLLALQWGGAKYAWSSWRVILLLVLFSVLFLAWLFSQWYQGDKATLPFRILRQRSLAAGSWFTFCLCGAMFIIVYYVPIWFQSVRGESAFTSGINLLASSASLSVVVIVGGVVVSRTGYYVPNMIVSVIFGAAGTGLVYTFDRHTSTVYWAAALVIMGIGIGCGIQQPLMAVQTVFDGADMAIATSAIVFIQAIAGTILLSAAQNTLQSKILSEISQIPGVDPRDIVDVGASDLYSAVHAKYPSKLNMILDAYNSALRGVFLIALVLMCLTVFGAAAMEWKSVKSRKNDVPKPDSQSDTTEKEEA